MAGEINVARYDNNEIIHKDDLAYGETREYENLTSLVERLAIASNDAIIEGGIVKQRGTPSMNVDIEAMLAFCVSTGKIAYYGSDFGPVSITNGGAQDRIDTLEVRVLETSFDPLQRAYKDPNTGDVSYQSWNAKLHYEIEAQLIEGTEGAGIAPNHTAGWIKIAEIDVDAGESTSILDADIHNVDAGYNTEVNGTWTSETAVTFRSKALTEVKGLFRVSHTEAGDHEADIIQGSHIDWGAGAGEVDADLMPLGTTISHAPTGGTDANLTSTSTVRQAVQKALDLLINLSGVQNDALDSRHIAAGAIDSEHIANDQVDSQHYAADSIDGEHMNWGVAAGQVDADLMPLGTAITHNPTGGTAASLVSGSTVRESVQKTLDLMIDLSGVENGAVDARHIGNDQVNSQHYATGSIDSEHIANDQVNSQHYAALSVDTEHIANNNVTLGKIAKGTLDAYLKGQGGSNSIYEKLALKDTGVKIANSTRSSAGDQVITGVGFRPSVVIIIGADTVTTNRNMSWGWSTVTDNQCYYQHTNGAQVGISVSACIMGDRGSGNVLMGAINAFGSDGFTITWQVGGSPPTMNFTYLCLP